MNIRIIIELYVFFRVFSHDIYLKLINQTSRSQFAQTFVEVLIHLRRSTHPHLLQVATVGFQAFLNEVVVPALLALVAQPQVELEVCDGMLFAQGSQAFAQV